MARGRRGTTPDASERTARSIVELALPGARLEFQPDQFSNQHDFNLELPNGSVVPLEVTQSVNFRLKSTQAALAQRGRNHVPRILCRNDWFVWPTLYANINKIHDHVDRMLADIEDEGIVEFFAMADASGSRAVWRILSELGIEVGRATRLRRPGIHVGSPSADGGLVTSESVQQAVAVEVAKPDNRLKFASSTAPERHLFVLIDSENFLPWISLLDCDPPATPPTLPTEITHVWAAARDRSQDQYVTWLGSSEGWINLGRFLVPQRSLGVTGKFPQ
jgi:hypothetical protein